MSLAPPWPGTNYYPRIEIGRPTDPGAQYKYDQAKYDTAGRYGPWYAWQSLECDVRDVLITRGSNDPASRPQSAVANITVSPKGATLAPWWMVNGERPNRANLPLRIVITDGVDIWPLFWGWVDIWQDVDNCDEVPVAVITASDGFRHLANLNQPERAAQGAGEAAGKRIDRILTNAGWDTERRLEPGTLPLQATTLAQPALDECFLAADTEGGYVWIDKEGAFRFVDRVWMRSKAEHTDWHVGDRSIDADCIPASGMITVADDMDVANVIGISRIGGVASWAEDTDSIKKYRRKSWSRFDLPYMNDTDTPIILAVQLGDRAHRDYHIEGLVLSPMAEPSAWPLTLNADLFDTVFVTRTRGTDHLEENAQIIGMEHRLSPALVTTTLYLGQRSRTTNARYDIDVYDLARYSGV